MRLRPIGQAPSSPLRTLGWLLLGALYLGLIASLVHIPVLVLARLFGRLASTPVLGTPGGALVMWFVEYPLTAWLGLLLAGGHGRLQWAAWWLLAVDAILRVVTAVAVLLGAPLWLYPSTLLDSIGDRPAVLALTAVAAALCTLAIVAAYTIAAQKEDTARQHAHQELA